MYVYVHYTSVREKMIFNAYQRISPFPFPLQS